MNDHIAKPVNPELLFATLLRWLPARPQAAMGTGHTANASAGSSETLLQRLAKIDGLDVARGLRNVANDAGRLQRVLQQFASEYENGLPALERAGSDAERAQCRLFAHSLRGASATVGAAALAEEFATLERDLLSQADSTALQTRGRALNEALRGLAGRLRAALA